MIIDNIIKKLYNLSTPNKKGGNYMAKSKKLGGSWILWLILQIFFGAITGFVARIIKGHILSGILGKFPVAKEKTTVGIKIDGGKYALPA